MHNCKSYSGMCTWMLLSLTNDKPFSLTPSPPPPPPLEVATGQSEVPYHNLQQLGVQIYGLPPNISFHSPFLYTQQELQQILANLEKIVFLKVGSPVSSLALIPCISGIVMGGTNYVHVPVYTPDHSFPFHTQEPGLRLCYICWADNGLSSNTLAWSVLVSRLGLIQIESPLE